MWFFRTIFCNASVLVVKLRSATKTTNVFKLSARILMCHFRFFIFFLVVCYCWTLFGFCLSLFLSWFLVNFFFCVWKFTFCSLCNCCSHSAYTLIMQDSFFRLPFFKRLHLEIAIARWSIQSHTIHTFMQTITFRTNDYALGFFSAVRRICHWLW